MSAAMAQAMVFNGAGEPLTLRQFPLPEPQGEEILVRVTCCTLCGSDLHTAAGRRTTPTPTILGHEIIGTIAAAGPDAEMTDFHGASLHIGDRITWSLAASCGDCFYCENDLPQKCERLFKYGHEVLRSGHELSGGLAQYCLLTEGTECFRLPNDLPDAIACPANCATATIAAALRTAGDIAGKSVLVQGAGMLGLTACAMARTAGAETILCCDLDEKRAAHSEAFGATRGLPFKTDTELLAAVQEATEGRGVDIAIEVSGARSAFHAGLAALRTGGVYVLVGTVFPGQPVSLDLETIVRRHLLLHGVHNYTPQDLAAALQFLTEHGNRFPFASLVAQSFPLAEANAAFAAGHSGAIYRVAVIP